VRSTFLRFKYWIVGSLWLGACTGASASPPAAAQAGRAARATESAEANGARAFSVVLLSESRCDGPRTAVIRDTATWRPLWACATAGFQPPQAPPPLDFQRELYLFVAPGASGGPSTLTIDSLAINRDTLVVNATYDRTGGCSSLAMVSNLAAIVRTAPWAGAVKTSISDLKRHCGS